jgi:polysaccharide deacetylase family protein (PEP-CTERM system associated)
MSVDVEEHFQVSAFENQISRRDWSSHPTRVAKNVDRILKLFDDANAKATFFVLGCVAARNPEVVDAIVSSGHEIASHGHEHRRVHTQTRQQFKEDVTRAKSLLEDMTGVQIAGYRAPSFSIVSSTPWAHEVLHEAGYAYSSSIYPVKHDHYGSPSAPRFPYRVCGGELLEIPLTTVRSMGRNWPGAGGGFFRLLPVAISRWAIARVHAIDQMPVVFYFHPWEVDPDQPRVPGIPLKSRFRHYLNLHKFESRLAAVLREFQWGRMDQVYREALRATGSSAEIHEA